MPQASAGALTRHYESLQRPWKVVERSADYSHLVVPNGNSREAIHRWFHLKEAFSSQLLAKLLKDACLDSARELAILDPFAGSGTTLVSAIGIARESAANVYAVGVERNPFLHLLGRAKAGSSARGHNLVKPIESQFTKIANEFQSMSKQSMTVPPSSTLNNSSYFPEDHVQALLRIRTAISTVSAGLARDIFKVCLAAAVEPSSRLRRDGRALRFEAGREPRDPWSSFESGVKVVLADLTTTVPSRSSASVKLGDGRSPHKYVDGSQNFDLIVFSPPYPNNIDYTEVYKTEAWILGCYKSPEDMRRQRLSTVRSHPSVRFDDVYSIDGLPQMSEFDRIIDPIMSAIPTDRYESGRRQLVRGYADDMLQVLKSCRRLAHDNSRLVFIVGNSVHGTGQDSFIIAADILIGALASIAGWRVEEIRVARHLTRRGTISELLRESVVSLRPT